MACFGGRKADENREGLTGWSKNSNLTTIFPALILTSFFMIIGGYRLHVDHYFGTA